MDGLDSFQGGADLIKKQKQKQKKVITNFKCWGCIFEINIGCNTLEGNSNLHGGKVNADVKIWFGIFAICQGLQQSSGFPYAILYHVKCLQKNLRAL